jgi:hypothetical protein
MTNAQQAPVTDRRFHLRGWFGHRTTGLIQALLDDPAKVASDLEADLRKGADARMTGALLAVARVFGDVRGIDLTSRIREVSSRLKSAGFEV